MSQLRRNWGSKRPLQDIVVLRGFCARINHLFIASSHLHCPHYCNTIARLLRNIRRPLGLPCVCYTPYNIGNGNIVLRPRLEAAQLMKTNSVFPPKLILCSTIIITVILINITDQGSPSCILQVAIQTKLGLEAAQLMKTNSVFPPKLIRCITIIITIRLIAPSCILQVAIKTKLGLEAAQLMKTNSGFPPKLILAMLKSAMKGPGPYYLLDFPASLSALQLLEAHMVGIYFSISICI